MREKYIPDDNQWVVFSAFDKGQFAEDVYSQVGATFPLTVNPDGTVLVNFDEVPAGISDNNIKNAVKDNHPHR